MENKTAFFISALKSGLIVGAVSIVMFLVMYVTDIKPVGIMMPILMALIGFGVNIAVLSVLFKKYRTSIGGYITFGNAFLYCFVALAVAYLLNFAFSYLFILTIEPDYYKKIMEAQKAWMENYLSGKVNEEQMAQQLDKLDEQAAKMNSIGSIAKNYAGTLVFSAIIALIMGAIMKKKPEMFDSNTGGVI